MLYLYRTAPCLLLAACLASCAPRLPRLLNENSGLALAAPDSLLWLNDSGNRPAVYSTDRRGRLRDSILFLKEKNTDWEELAHDPADGRLFIGDFGNNSNARRDLHILIFHPKTRATERLDFAWPDQLAFPPKSRDGQNFDCEAMVYWRDSLHLFTKSHWLGRSFVCRHYVVAARPGRQTPVFLEEVFLKNRVVSGAALSADGRRLVLVGYRFGLRFGFVPFAKASLFSFQKSPGNLFFTSKPVRQRAPGWPFGRQYEALAFTADGRILLSNEKLLWQKPRIRRVRLK